MPPKKEENRVCTCVCGKKFAHNGHRSTKLCPSCIKLRDEDTLKRNRKKQNEYYKSQVVTVEAREPKPRPQVLTAQQQFHIDRECHQRDEERSRRAVTEEMVMARLMKGAVVAGYDTGYARPRQVTHISEINSYVSDVA